MFGHRSLVRTVVFKQLTSIYHKLSINISTRFQIYTYIWFDMVYAGPAIVRLGVVSLNSHSLQTIRAEGRKALKALYFLLYLMCFQQT